MEGDGSRAVSNGFRCAVVNITSIMRLMTDSSKMRLLQPKPPSTNHHPPRPAAPLPRCPQLFDDRLERGDDLALVDPALAEAHSQVELLRLRAERKDERPRAPGLRLGGLFPHVLPRDAVAAVHQALDERHHLLRVRLPD